MILKKKEIITKINTGRKNKEKQTDQILIKLDLMIDENLELNEILQDPEKCSVCLVMNPDKLSLSESEDIIKELDNLRMPLKKVIINKCDEPTAFEDDLRNDLKKSSFSKAEIITLSTHCREVTGLADLADIKLPENYLD